MDSKTFRTLLIGVVIGSLVVGGAGMFLLGKQVWQKFGLKDNTKTQEMVKKEIVDEESVVTKVVEQATPSVVTISIVKPKVSMDIFGMIRRSAGEDEQQQDIGTGFVISKDGLIVTNRHVVSDSSAKYKVIIGKDDMVEVKQIYRDPANDLAILKVDRDSLVPVNMGDSDKIKVGGTVIAIGTALGQFRSTVTTGVISGVGRGITAGDPWSGAEKIDNVIQTDAAINPGNSGGPLFNSSGEVVGVNVAVSQAGQNIGFALPINLVKESIENFKTTGEFERPYLGVAYREINKQTALLNDVPAGGYVSEVVDGSPAQKAEIQIGDIIVEVDGKKLIDNKTTSLVTIINKKKIGDTVEVKVWRDGKDLTLKVMLEKRPS